MAWMKQNEISAAAICDLIIAHHQISADTTIRSMGL